MNNGQFWDSKELNYKIQRKMGKILWDGFYAEKRRKYDLKS